MLELEKFFTINTILATSINGWNLLIVVGAAMALAFAYFWFDRGEKLGVWVLGIILAGSLVLALPLVAANIVDLSHNFQHWGDSLDQKRANRLCAMAINQNGNMGQVVCMMTALLNQVTADLPAGAEICPLGFSNFSLFANWWWYGRFNLQTDCAKASYVFTISNLGQYDQANGNLYALSNDQKTRTTLGQFDIVKQYGQAPIYLLRRRGSN